MNKLLSLIGNAQLREIRDNCDWRNVWQFLGVQKDETRSKVNDWWGKSPLVKENTASFHFNDQGWYCFSSQKGGGVIELVQAISSTKGEALNCYQAGEWLVANGLSHFSHAGRRQGELKTPVAKTPSSLERSEKKDQIASRALEAKLLINKPVKLSLVPFYATDFYHPHLAARGITKKTYEYLRAGFLPKESASGMAGRLVFQIRSMIEGADGVLRSVIVSHMGRAIGKQAEQQGGKWRFYGNFHKSLELYHLDRLVCTDQDETRAQAQLCKTQTVILCEGCFDVAALVEAGFYTAIASFGAHLSNAQIDKLALLRLFAPDLRVLIWYDRDQAGQAGAKQAGLQLQQAGFEVSIFDWARVKNHMLEDISEFSSPEIIDLLCPQKNVRDAARNKSK